jgi:hypothetical protein
MNFKQSLPPDLYQQATASHPYRFKTAAPTPAGYTRLDSAWTLNVHRSCGNLTTMATRDLIAFMRATFGLNLKRGDAARTIRVTIGEFSSIVREGYELSVTRDGIDVIAHDDEGAMRALFHLRRDMLLARAPVVKLGQSSHAPKWELRVNYPLVHEPIDRPAEYLDYPDAYLLNMARYGYNATYVYLDLFDYVSPKTEPLLGAKDYRRRIDDLNRAIARLKAFGLRTLFHMNTLVLPPDHAIFKKHPEMRGARSWSAASVHCLCSSSRRVLDLYERVSSRLFTDCPDLAGAVVLVGGECFLHCYSRPHPRTDAGTHCPACKKRAVDDVVSGVANAVTRGATSVNPAAEVLIWQYSGFVWGDNATQARVIQKLDPRASSLETFEKDDWLTIDGTKSYVFDYSISQLGPSPRFKQLSAAAKRKGVKFFGRTEASQTIDMFVLPRLPIMHRWAARAKGLRDANVSGVHSSWRFYGFIGQMTDEVLDHYAWAEKPDGEALLKQIAARDFGPKASTAVVRAWKELSEAFGQFPYSGAITGFPYFRGPFFIGPAHPLVFDHSSPIDLPPEFFTTDPSLGEGFKDVESVAQRRPNFFLDLLWTQPFGAKKIRKPLESMQSGWSRGVELLQGAMKTAGGDDRKRLGHELDLARMIGCCCRTTLNLLTLQELRAKVTEEPCTLKDLRVSCNRAIEVLRDEIDNAKEALAIARRNPSFGFGSAYGRAFGPELIQAKIDHCQRQITHGIPYFYEIYAFHIFAAVKRE